MNVLAHKRKQLLQQMEQIERMEYGSVQEELRPSRKDPAHKQGPYFKHQVWEDGRNASRRVPSEEADDLMEAIEGRKQFEELASKYIETTVAMTRTGSPGLKKKK